MFSEREEYLTYNATILYSNYLFKYICNVDHSVVYQ